MCLIGEFKFPILFKSLLCVCVSVCTCLCARARACTHTFVGILVGPYKGVGFSGAAMTGGCELHGMVAGN